MCNAMEIIREWIIVVFVGVGILEMFFLAIIEVLMEIKENWFLCDLVKECITPKFNHNTWAKYFHLVHSITTASIVVKVFARMQSNYAQTCMYQLIQQGTIIVLL